MKPYHNTRELAWKAIVELQDGRHPNWRTEMPRTMLTTGLVSEVGGVCDQVTHLDGGGSQMPDPEKWSNDKVLHDLVDTFVMIILVAEKSGFSEGDFWDEFRKVRGELGVRLQKSLLASVNCAELRSKPE